MEEKACDGQIELFESLSREAKLIICILLNAPQEMYESFRSKDPKRIYSTRKLKHILYERSWELGWTYSIIRESLGEVRDFLKRLQPIDP